MAQWAFGQRSCDFDIDAAEVKHIGITECEQIMRGSGISHFKLWNREIDWSMDRLAGPSAKSYRVGSPMRADKNKTEKE